MTEWFSSVSAFAVFLVIAGVGFLFLLISLIFGEIFEFFEADADFDHSFEHGGPSFFSTRVLSVFITAFGAVGAIGVRYGMGTGAASAAGAASGLALGSLIYVFARFLYSQQASSDLSVRDLVGQTGRVVVAIPTGGVGQIRLQIGESLVDKIARSHDGQPIPENAVAKVEEVLGETLVVRRP
jgi:membrane protein implicated in regulation of membrane protease activity